MISVVLAQRLRAAGLTWRPASGDRFAVQSPELDGETFVLSDMTVEVHRLPSGPIIGFNGTVEWALDSVTLDRALWLPDETALRKALGEHFVRLERDGDDYVVLIRVGDSSRGFRHAEPAEAYGRALLHLLAEGE